MKNYFLFFILLLSVRSVISCEIAQSIDYLIYNSIVVTMEKESEVLYGSSIAIADEAIVYIGKESKLKGCNIKTRINGNGRIILPGLVNTHTHLSNTGQAAVKRLGKQEKSSSWWKRAFINEKKTLTKDGARLNSDKGIKTFINEGVTTVNDMSFFSNEVYKSVKSNGIRAFLSETLISRESVSYKNIEEAEKLNDELEKKLRGSKLIYLSNAVLALGDITEAGFRKVVNKEPALIHIHWGETEVENIKSRSRLFSFLIKNINNNDLHIVFAHCVHIKNDFYDYFSGKENAGVSLNLSSNDFLSTGSVDVYKYLKKGLLLTIGTDSSVTNSHLSMWNEMRTMKSNNKKVPAYQILKMATYNGAKALGIDDQIGSLVKGKRADLIVLKLNDKKVMKKNDIMDKILESYNSSVDLVFINGQLVKCNQKVKGVCSFDSD